MSLATAAAIGSVLLLIASQINRRTRSESPLLKLLIKVLAVIVLALVAAYFYQRFVS